MWIITKLLIFSRCDTITNSCRYFQYEKLYWLLHASLGYKIRYNSKITFLVTSDCNQMQQEVSYHQAIQLAFHRGTSFLIHNITVKDS